MKTTILNFGGFYESIHSENINSMVQMYEDADDETDVVEFKNYTQLHIKYSKHFVSFVNELVNSNLRFSELISPKYYNYSTDIIECIYTKKDFTAIKKYIKSNKLQNEVELHIKDLTTSKSGYVAFFEYSDIFLPENDSILLQCYLDVIIKNNSDEWSDYYDRQNVYEIIYSL